MDCTVLLFQYPASAAQRRARCCFQRKFPWFDSAKKKKQTTLEFCSYCKLCQKTTSSTV